LKLAVENGVKSIGFPSISTGAYGYPNDEAAKIAWATIKVLHDASTSIEEVRLVFFSKNDLNTFLESCGL
jgi:O-acetyl-ADP-ribose deacetylase (regulator of RNase III)